MKKFVSIILLALAAVLTTCTPCEAKGKNREALKKVEATMAQLLENIRPYADDDMWSLDGNYHWFEFPGEGPKNYIFMTDFWFFEVCPRSHLREASAESRTFFHYADGTIEEVLSDDQLETIKMNIYGKN